MSKMEPIIYKLIEPVSIVAGGGERTVTQLTFARKMKGKDLAAQDFVDGKMMKSFALYASMCNEPIQVFTEMESEDFTEMALMVAPLMGKRAKQMVDAQMKKAALGDLS